MNTQRLLCAILSLFTAVSMTVSPIPDMAITSCAITAIAEEGTLDTGGITYMIQDDTVLITGCDKNAAQIVIPDTIEGLPVTQLEGNLFMGCKNLQSVTLPQYLTSIPFNCFDGCSSLTSVNIPEGVTTIGNGAFACCESLKEITFPPALKSIKSGAFNDCTSLTEVTLPQGLEVLYAAFIRCSSLETIHIPASVTDMPDLFMGFSDCSSLEAIIVDPDNTVYQSIDNVLFSKDGSKLLLYPRAKKNTEYTVPDTVTEIANRAFLCAENLTSVTLPAHMTVIESFAFWYCTSLKTLTFPKSLLKIGERLFEKVLLTDVYYEGSVQDWSRIDFNGNESSFYGATIHFGAEDTAVHQKVTLYTEPSSLSIPAEYASYQIETNSPDAAFGIIAGNAAEVSETGLVKPTGRYGETIIKITDGEQVSFLHVTTEDYLEFCADAKITAFLEENITDDMTDIEKLYVIGKLPASMDYDRDHWVYTEMIAYNTGNCAGNATMLVEMCRRLGIKAWVRNANRDPNVGSAHVNALAEVDGVYYELEAGYSGTAPRPYNITKRTSLCKYKDAADGIDVYQYDGINDAETALELPDVIDGKTVTRIGDGFLKENPWVKSVTIPDTVSEISESAFPDFKGILYGAEDSAAARFAAAHGIAFRVTGSNDPGDVNADGSVSILDLVMLQKWLLAVPDTKLTADEAADLNKDGIIDVFDLGLLKRLLLKK